MYYEIYIDSIFLINFVMNLCLFVLLSKTLCRTATRGRLLLGSLAGAALFCIILIIPRISYPVKIIIGLIPANMITMKLTFRIKKLKQLCYLTLWAYCYAFFLGGTVLFLQGRISFLREHSDAVWCVIGSVGIAYMVCDYAVCKYKKKRADNYYQVHIPYQGKQVTVKGLIDTGNRLIEPVSGRPVSILDKSIWGQLEALKRADKYKIIPFHSVGKNNGMMEAYEVEKIIIEDLANDIVCSNCIIAICSDRVSSEGNYQMILHPELLNKNKEAVRRI